MSLPIIGTQSRMFSWNMITYSATGPWNFTLSGVGQQYVGGGPYGYVPTIKVVQKTLPYLGLVRVTVQSGGNEDSLVSGVTVTATAEGNNASGVTASDGRVILMVVLYPSTNVQGILQPFKLSGFALTGNISHTFLCKSPTTGEAKPCDQVTYQLRYAASTPQEIIMVDNSTGTISGRVTTSYQTDSGTIVTCGVAGATVAIQEGGKEQTTTTNNEGYWTWSPVLFSSVTYV